MLIAARREYHGPIVEPQPKPLSDSPHVERPEPVVRLSLLRYVSRPQDLRPYNRITPLRDGGAAYPAMLTAIRTATESVNLETYILRSDSIGRRFGEALMERARANVTVRVIYDSFGSMGIDEAFLAEWRAAGVRVIEYNPLAPWRKRWSVMRRDHRKILVVDNCMAFTGGMNIGEDYASLDDGGGGWRDMHAVIEGPVVLDLAALFLDNWVRSGGESFDLPESVPPASTSETLARVINNREFVQRFRFRRAYTQAMTNAQRTISIMNAYFLPGIRLRRVLKKAVERGVVVRVIVPGTSDVKLVQLACGNLYRRLLRAGIHIYEWPDRMMHAKTAVIDGAWSTIGSYNLDNQSLLQNLEVAIAAIDDEFGALMNAEFEADIAVCHQVTLEEVKKWSVWRRIKGWLAFRIRRWL